VRRGARAEDAGAVTRDRAPRRATSASGSYPPAQPRHGRAGPSTPPSSARRASPSARRPSRRRTRAAGAGTGRPRRAAGSASWPPNPCRLLPSGSHPPAQPRYARAGCASASRRSGRSPASLDAGAFRPARIPIRPRRSRRRTTGGGTGGWASRCGQSAKSRGAPWADRMPNCRALSRPHARVLGRPVKWALRALLRVFSGPVQV